MKPTSFINSLFAISLISAGGVVAGETVKVSGKGGPTVEAPYEANRGLLTIEGPTGLFINPTSATLPKGAFTAQYCFFLPDFDFKDVIAHGALLGYGVTDWLEVGAIGLYLQDADLWAVGPMVRLRLLKHEGCIPQFSIGAYGKFGDRALTDGSAYAALTERFEVKAGPIKSVAFDAGVREQFSDTKRDNFRGYFGLEVQFPARFYAIGEIATKSSVDNVVPWAAGFQWRAGGINVSTAAVETGDGGKLGFFFGIGTQF